MVKVQVSVTPSEAKRLIAKAVAQMPAVRSALQNGKILLKGGTTVSAIAEELGSIKLKISGRITQLGTKVTFEATTEGPHRLLFECGQPKGVESEQAIEEAALAMGKNDVLITGANALDVNRRAALMIAHPLGGQAKLVPAIMAKGVTTIIAVGWEKLIPCTIDEALMAAGRDKMDLAMGAAVGLMPLFGTVVTETDAVSMLAGVKATVIGAGGILGGEGSTIFVIEGERSNVKTAWEVVRSVKGAAVSGLPDSLIECKPGRSCRPTYPAAAKSGMARHQTCVYRQPKLVGKVFATE